MTLVGPGLPDAEARRRVRVSLSETLFVEAGAGSGKTTSLVERIVNLVAHGAPVARIAAITFTEAAARELRTRVRDELERQGAERADRQLINAAGQVESAAFTTLHGFALRLLADHPVEAGLPPGFAVADEIGSMLEFQEAWRTFSAQLGDDLDLLDLLERAAALGVEVRHFADVARRFDDNWDLLDRLAEPPALSPLDPGPMVAAVAALGQLVDHCLDPADHLVAGLTELASAAAAALRRDAITQLRWLDQVRWPRRNVGRKASWVRLDVDEVRRRVAGVQDQVAADVARHRHEVINHLVARVAGFVAARVEARQARGELAFHDLLVLARRLLRSNALVREELHQRYSRILLDEFQDTDPIQIELAVLLGADGLVGDRSWPELAATLEPGRLVVVGDPKQSIYRFRRADMAVYARAEEALVELPLQLTTNFRSVPGVVGLVNDLFQHLIGEGEPEAQPRFVPLAPFRAADPETDVPVLVIGGPHPRTVPVGEIRELEAADVAAVICRAMEEEWRCEREGQWRPVRLQDIAVLIPSRLSLPALETAFGAANIPFRPETSSLVYATQEVRDVLAGVRAVVDPANAVDVVAALRSGLFALGDGDLVSWHLAGGSFDFQHLEASIDLRSGVQDHPVGRALAVLASWHRDRWWTEPAALIERIVRERRLREAALAEPRPRDRWRRYRFLAEQAREFTATRGGDLHDFVAWVEVQSSDMARVTEPIPAEPDDDAVRVLTIHGSKGLEFPLVVVAGAPTRDANRGSGPQVLFPPSGPPEVKVGKDRSTADFDVHASVEELLDRHERVRLHYVATTRARDLLVLSAHHREGLQSSGQRTWEALERCDPNTWRLFQRQGGEGEGHGEGQVRYSAEPPTQLRLSAGSWAETARVWNEEQGRLLDRTHQVRTWSATGVAERLAPLEAPDLGRSGSDQADGPGVTGLSPLDTVAGRRPAGTAVGIAVHDTMEQVALTAGPEEVALAAARAAARAGIPHLAADVADLAASFLQAPVVELARRGRFWRELYVAAPVGEALLEGFVDLCVETEAGLVIVDYKTDLIASGDDIQRKLRHYRWQGAAYAVALERVTGRPVAGCCLLFVGPDGVVEQEVADLAEAAATVVELISAG
jgi:ATP-dependent helicase/nuclease subunit A